MKKLIVACAAILLCACTSYGQTVKLGHINSNQLLSLMPETKAADSALQKLQASLVNQLQAMSNEYDTKVENYKKDEPNLLPAVKETRVKEIQDLEERIRTFQQTAQENASAKKEEIFKPILDKADEAIKAVAKEKGYTYIFDASGGVLLYASDSDDILPLVKAKLNLK